MFVLKLIRDYTFYDLSHYILNIIRRKEHPKSLISECRGVKYDMQYTDRLVLARFNQMVSFQFFLDIQNVEDLIQTPVVMNLKRSNAVEWTILSNSEEIDCNQQGNTRVRTGFFLHF